MLGRCCAGGVLGGGCASVLLLVFTHSGVAMMARHADSTSMVIALIAMGLCLRLIPQAAGFGARCRGLLVLVMANALTTGVGLYLIGEQMQPMTRAVSLAGSLLFFGMLSGGYVLWRDEVLRRLRVSSRP